MLDYFLICWKKYADFTGRARRREFWYFSLGCFILSLSLSLLSTILAAMQLSAGVVAVAVIYALFAVASLLPSLAVQVRRLHDTGRSA